MALRGQVVLFLLWYLHKIQPDLFWFAAVLAPVAWLMMELRYYEKMFHAPTLETAEQRHAQERTRLALNARRKRLKPEYQRLLNAYLLAGIALSIGLLLPYGMLLAYLFQIPAHVPVKSLPHGCLPVTLFVAGGSLLILSAAVASQLLVLRLKKVLKGWRWTDIKRALFTYDDVPPEWFEQDRH